MALLACAAISGLCSSAQAQEITRSGTLRAVVTDNFRTGESTTRYSLVSGGRAIPLRPTTLAAEPGERVVVSGDLREGTIVGPVTTTTTSAQPLALAEPRKVAVVLVTFPGDPAEPWLPEATRSKVFTAANSANAFYQEESYGEISLKGKLNEDGDVFGWLALDTPTTQCSFMAWKDAANAAAAAEGIDLTGYQHIVYVFPKRDSCGWLGLAAVGGDWAMINGDQGVHAIAHELGHNLGLEHAGSLTCFSGAQRVQISNSCAVTEYGDPFDVMGNIAARHSNGWNLAKLGILGPQNVETVETSGTYSMRSALDKTNETTVLRVPRAKFSDGDIASWYYLEVRKTGGLFENVNDGSTTGVSIRIPQATIAAETVLLDANPATTTFQDAPLKVGQMFDTGPVQITTVAAGGGNATVSVDLDEEAPTPPTNLMATVGLDGVKLQWSPSTDNVGFDSYVVFRDGIQIDSSEGIEFLDARAPAGEHTYVVYAEDEFHNRSDASEPAVVTVPEFEGPICVNATCEVTFRYSGGEQTWTVPPGVEEAEFKVEGARGGGFGFNLGARLVATLEPLTAGEVVTVSVGGAGEPITDGGEGGFGGGGDGTFGAGGGGFSSIKLEGDLMLLAGGGGGEGARGFNATTAQEPVGGRGGQGGEVGTSGSKGGTTTALGATLEGGKGGNRGGSFDPPGTDGAGGAGGLVSGANTCEDGASPGASGAAGSSMSGGGDAPNAGGGGGGGYFGGGQGAGGASDKCGNKAGWGGGGGGSSFAAPGVFAEFTGGVRSGDGQVWISYPNPVAAEAQGYTAEQNQELVIPAGSGVLSGASGPEGVPLAASLANAPGHGAATVANDGSFTYMPASGFTGSDSFTYRVDDASGHYATAQVKLTIAQPPSVSISVSPTGDTYTPGQLVRTVFSCGEGAGGPGLSSCNDSSGIETGQGGTGLLDTSTLGIHTYTVTAVSKDGLADSASISYLVGVAESAPPPLPEAPPKTEISLAVEGRSLRDLLNTGKLIVATRVNKSVLVELSGKAMVNDCGCRAGGPKFVEVFKQKLVSLPGSGERKVTLVLTRKGRSALRHLRMVRLRIVGSTTDAAGEETKQTVVLTLRR
ncbi:MAG TPA: Ig-like domain-containing protein [Solirubrobacterales bacterium]|nr:Ig-like domain-containing protein [Solirubrobacterales bacterium]